MRRTEWLYLASGPGLGLLGLFWYSEEFGLPFRVGGTIFLFWAAIVAVLVCAWALRRRPAAVMSSLVGTGLVLCPISIAALAWTAWSIGGFAP